jgi:hypothetical protein
MLIQKIVLEMMILFARNYVLSFLCRFLRSPTVICALTIKLKKRPIVTRSRILTWNSTIFGEYLPSDACDIIIIIIFSGFAAKRELWPPRSRGFVITHNDAPQSLGLIWTSDHLVADISTWQHTIHTTDKHPFPRLDSNTRSQQARGRRPTH